MYYLNVLIFCYAIVGGQPTLTTINQTYDLQATCEAAGKAITEQADSTITVGEGDEEKSMVSAYYVCTKK
jgi:hypothetical protein